jgi:hypothetical protein
MVTFKARYGMKPTALVMYRSDAELLIEAHECALSLFEGLEISVNPLASASELRHDVRIVRSSKGRLHYRRRQNARQLPVSMTPTQGHMRLLDGTP